MLAFTTPPYVINTIYKFKIADFVWNGNKNEKKRQAYRRKRKRRFRLPEYEIITKSLLCAWVKIMKDSGDIVTAFPSYPKLSRVFL